ncbi:MAG: hypothetical protein O7D30_07875 [Rickettsia endosymbiont of Ixodes persulcatus]|nr:hypothetical protein [Rickettsia endosymbiont of Ixodes persulcatus]
MTYLFEHLNKKTKVSSEEAIDNKHSLMQRLIFNYPYESYKTINY